VARAGLGRSPSASAAPASSAWWRCWPGPPGRRPPPLPASPANRARPPSPRRCWAPGRRCSPHRHRHHRRLRHRLRRHHRRSSRTRHSHSSSHSHSTIRRRHLSSRSIPRRRPRLMPQRRRYRPGPLPYHRCHRCRRCSRCCSQRNPVPPKKPYHQRRLDGPAPMASLHPPGLPKCRPCPPGRRPDPGLPPNRCQRRSWR
jgi:hypothetical protein